MDDVGNSIMPHLMNIKKILIFGVFDGVHDGHLSFINEARSHGDQLVAIVARDSVVEKLKGKLPKYNEVERIKDLLEVKEIDLVFLGDPETGTYNILKEIRPDIVFLGYDQNVLCEDLKKAVKKKNIPDVEIITGIPYKSDSLHSSILNNK